MKFAKIIMGLMFSLSVGFAHGAIITSLSAAGELETAVAGATVINFNDYSCGAYASCSGDFQIVTGSVSGQYAQPYGTGAGNPYLTVPNPSQNGSALFSLGTTADYFGLYWGSIDSYNTITFLLGDDVVGSFTGSAIAPPADGNQSASATNRYVNFEFTDGLTFDAVRFTSNGFAFESDNHAFRATASVPEPATAMLMLLGLLGLVGARKRQR